MAIAGKSAPSLGIAWHNEDARQIAIIHAEGRPVEAITPIDKALPALSDGTVWIRSIDADALRDQGYTIQPAALWRLAA